MNLRSNTQKVITNKRDSRTPLIREAIHENVERREQAGWPEEFLRFQGVKNTPAFESTREELKEASADPFAR